MFTYRRICSLNAEYVLSPKNVFSYRRRCSLTVEIVLSTGHRVATAGDDGEALDERRARAASTPSDRMRLFLVECVLLL